jgi:hypothetical protein
MHRFVLTILLAMQLTSCVAQNQIVGLWSFVDNRSTYWEEIYTDSLFWVYSEELGVVMRKYLLQGDTCLIQTYMNGTHYADYEIKEVSSNRISYMLDGQLGVLNRIRSKYDFNAIVQGDSAKRANYVEEYRKRKYRWESKHRKQ